MLLKLKKLEYTFCNLISLHVQNISMRLLEFIKALWGNVFQNRKWLRLLPDAK